MYADTTIEESFINQVADILKRHPEGLSEHQLLHRLHELGYFSFLGGSPWQPHALFCAHFLLFHVLYRLRELAWREQLANLEINPLKICWSDYQAGENAVGAADPLREYYLDLSNLQRTSERDVDELLASFWVRFQREDQREDALAILGLSDPVDDTTIKQTYRQLAMQHHPDRGGETERLQAINAAVKVLLKTG
ncbi:DNA-J related domain-containing protein [Thiogranum longum]